MLKDNYALKSLRNQLIFVLMLLTVPIFSQHEAAEGYLYVTLGFRVDPEIKDVRNCIVKDGIPQSYGSWWVVKNTHSSKNIEAGFRLPHTHTVSLNGQKEQEGSGEATEVRIIPPGAMIIICCKTERDTNRENGVFIETTEYSEPYIKWAHFVE
jgi:hypothetical protein